MSSSTLPPWTYLDAARDLIEALVYAPDEAKDALAATIAASHVRGAFGTYPRFLVTAEVPEAGKSTMASDVPYLLAYSPAKVGKLTTAPALTSMFLSKERPTLICDDVGKVFGDAGLGGRNSQLYALLVEGYTKRAIATFSANRVSLNLPCGTFAWMNGLHNAVPGDLLTRCIHVRIEPKPSRLKLWDALDPNVEAEAACVRDALHAWATSQFPRIKDLTLNGLDHVHPGLTDRKRQIWGPPMAVALAAGGTWPERMRRAFMALALDQSTEPVLTPDQRLLLDAAGIVAAKGADKIFTADLLTLLKALPDRPFYGDVSNEYLVTSLFPRVLGESTTMRGTILTGPDAGKPASAKGRLAIPILKAAADLRARLYPEADAEDVPSAVDDELTVKIAK